MSLVGLLTLVLYGCGLTPFVAPGVEQSPEVPEGLEIGLDPAVDLELAQPKGPTKHIPSDTGIGTWDDVNRIYTLNKDVNDSIYIVEGNLTLDGAGHTITGSGLGYGVFLYQRSNITVKNCVVSGFDVGIYLYSSSSNTLTGNTADNNYIGIRLYSSSSNTLTGNTADNNYIGIYLYYSSSNTLTGNTADNNYIGMYLYKSNSNKVYNNNFINNPTQAYAYYGSGNEFSLDKLVGGNYWNDWTSPDVNYDGFVDDLYVFTGGQDDLPWICQDGWKPTVATGYLITIVEDFELPKGVEKSLITLLEVAINALENQHEQAAIGQLTGFIHHVEAQSGKKLTEEQAQTLIAAVQRIIDSIQ